MRVRNRKGASELLATNPQFVISNPEECKGKWAVILTSAGIGKQYTENKYKKDKNKYQEDKTDETYRLHLS